MPQLSDSSEFQFAQLSMAAYATLSPTLSDDQYKQALQAAGFSARLAADFVTRYRVVEQSDPVQFGSGFSATVFEELDPVTGLGTGKKILAIKGTDTPIDFTTDLEVLFGVPSDFNLQYGELKRYYQDLFARGVLPSTQTFSVAGHSLGGYLAQAFTADPAFASNVSHAYTYNAPGFGGIWAEIAETLGFSPASIPNPQITNFLAQNGVSGTAGLGQLVGSIENIFIEEGDALNNHSINTSTDSLAMYALFGQIDPTSLAVQQIDPLDPSLLSIPTVTDILKAASNIPANSLESGLDALRKLFTPAPGGTAFMPTPISTSMVTDATNVANRNTYYSNLLTLSNTLNSVPVGTYRVIDLTLVSAAAIAGAAERTDGEDPNAIAYRYALRELNPFAVLGADYSQHNPTGGLDLFNVTTRPDGLTNNYIQDRAQFLEEKIVLNLADASVSNGNIHFADRASNYEITTTADSGTTREFLFGGDHADALVSGDQDDHLYGGGGEDVLLGGGGKDYLEGGTGNDILAGGTGDDDTLKGGAGFDTYIYSLSDGQDTISDSDRRGAILYDNHLITGGIHKDTDQLNMYTSLDGTFTFAWNGPGTDLTINNLLTVQNFQDGDFGVGLVEVEAPEAPAPPVVPPPPTQPSMPDQPTIDFSNTLTQRSQLFDSNGDPVTFDDGANDYDYRLDPQGDGFLVIHAQGGNDGILAGPGADQLFGEAGGDDLFGFEGNDQLVGGTEDDRLWGDTFANDSAMAGDDELDGGAGDDDLRGGGGTDVLVGGADNDLLYGDGPQVTEQVGPSTWDPSGDAPDWLDGGDGNDALVGGGGDDVLLGGAGTDRLWGDYNTEQGVLSFTPYVFVPLVSGVSGVGGQDWLDGGADDDVLEGGRGDDVLLGGDDNDDLRGDVDETTAFLAFDDPSSFDWDLSWDGQDFLDGGAGNDVLQGGGGDDTLFGGDGDDQLFADYAFEGSDSFAGNDFLDGGAGDDLLAGDFGDDVLLGGEGNDTLDGGVGNDVLDGGDGDDNLFGAAGDDVLTGGAGNDQLFGDELTGAGVPFGNDLLEGGDGDDFLSGDAGADTMIGGAGNDLYDVDDPFDSVIELAGEGVDEVQAFVSYALPSEVENLSLFSPLDINGVPEAINGTGNELNNIVIGSAGDNLLDGAAGDDALYGGEGDDVLAGGTGNDVLSGDDVGTVGNDVLYGEDGDDQMYGGEGNDLLYGGDRTDRLFGDAGNDLLDGGDGDDELSGEDGNDILLGGAGADLLEGGNGDDILDGGAGQDTYVFNVGDGVDRITDTSTGNILVFGAGISSDSISLGLGSLLVRVGHSGDAIHVENFDPADPSAFSSLFSFQFADGTALTTEQLLARGFDLIGTEFNDSLDGGELYRRVLGQGGNDQLFGGSGDNILLGGAGDDILNGGAGDDIYVFNLGDGVDTIQDTATPGEGNRILFGAGITAADLTLTQDQNMLIITYGVGGDAIRLADFDPNNVNGSLVVQTLQFADDSTFNLADLFPPTNVNHAPTLANPVTNQSALEDAAFSFQVPAETFADVDPGDTLTLSASLANGDPLPTWLSFDSATATFSGTPSNDDVGTINVTVTATDGGNLGASDTFALTVTNVNDAPVLVNPLANQSTLEDAAFSFVVPANTFADVDVGDTLMLSAALDNGDPLPAWLAFDATTGTFSGTPEDNDVGSLSIRVTATDTGNLSAANTFALTVVNVNDAPTVAQALADQSTLEDAAFSFVMPADAFVDQDAGDTLTLSAMLVDGNPLPMWLAFDATTQSFSGTPGNSDVGTVNVTLTATDQGNLSAANTFALTVVNVNDAPTVANLIADQTAVEDAPFNFQAPVDTFADVDAGDVLAYSALPADGNALPGWLSFDAATRTFSGTPSFDDIGTVGVTVTATDSGGLTVEDMFALTVRIAPDQVVVGTDGDDVLKTSSGNDVIDARGGNDAVIAGRGNDTLTGGVGNDILGGGPGDDTYVYNLGDGLDQVTDPLGVDTVSFGAGLSFDTVVARLTTTAGLTTAHLRLLDAGGCELPDQGMDIPLDAGEVSPIERFAFADGSVFALSDLVIQTKATQGTNGSDVVRTGRHDDVIETGNGDDFVSSGSGHDTAWGGNGKDSLYGDGGNDALSGANGEDLLDGGCGDDLLNGGNGKDTLQGGPGDDLLDTGKGEDTILFGRGDGHDALVGRDHNHGDEVEFGAGVAIEHLWFQRSGNDLTVSVLDTAGPSDQLNIADWYTDKKHRVDEFQTADGHELEDKRVEQLVQAMAAFAPPALGPDMTLPPDIQQQLAPALAAAWEQGH